MANKNVTNFTTIFKRQCCLESSSNNKVINPEKEITITKSRIDNAIKDGKPGILSPSFLNNCSRFMSLFKNKENSNIYFREIIDILSKITCSSVFTDDFKSQMTKEFNDGILPYIEDTNMVGACLSRYEIPTKYFTEISSAIQRYHNADRIINNHKMISNYFNITSEISKARSRNLQSVVENCCELIDTYNRPDYVKFNLCLEELSYLVEKENIPCKKDDLVKFVTEYFLLRSPKTSEGDFNKYRQVLRENCCITDEDTDKVDYFLTGEKSDNRNIARLIKEFMIKNNKSEEDLFNLVRSIFNDGNNLDISNNINQVIWLFWLIYRKDCMDNNQIIDFLNTEFVDNIEKVIERCHYSQQELDVMYTRISNENNKIIVSGSDNTEYCNFVFKFKDAIRNILDTIDKYYSVTYSRKNIDAMRVTDYEDADNEVSLNEFRIFKFHNLINASLRLDKYLKYKAQKVYNKGINGGKKVIGKIKDILFSESIDTLYSVIGEDRRADLCVAQIPFEESELVSLKEFLEATCVEFNSTLVCENMSSIKCFYTINPGVAEIHLKEDAIINLTEEEIVKCRESYNPSLDIYIEAAASAISFLEGMEYISENELYVEDLLENFKNIKNFDFEKYQITLEALSCLDVSHEQVKLFEEQFNKYRYNNAILESADEEQAYVRESHIIETYTNNWKPFENPTLEMTLCASQMLEAVMEANNIKKPNLPKAATNVKNKINDKMNSKEVDKDRAEDIRKNPFKGINLNTMRLYLEGLKKKMTNMSQKEKEISRNLDNSFRYFVKTMKNALVSDRREAIIKGSVIPSFSRCMKICISLAGLGFVTGNPVIPLMVAMGGFAVSKRLTQKERILLLDEIETELQVVDKEIANADAKNQIKKYRALLKYKKDLQRQYQRIRYNIRVGKDILPGSASGIRGNED